MTGVQTCALPIFSTESGVKKIKASAIGGSDVATITFDFNGGNIRTVETSGEIKALFNAGKHLVGKMTMPEEIQSGTTVFITIGMISFTSAYNGMFAYTIDGGTASFAAYRFEAATDNDVFTMV